MRRRFAALWLFAMLVARDVGVEVFAGTLSPGGGTSAQGDVCLNYHGIETSAGITAKGFVADGQGKCHLRRNQEAFAASGIDRTLMAGLRGTNVRVAVIDSGFFVTHASIAAQIADVASYHDLNRNYRLNRGEKIPHDAAPLVAAHGTSVASLVAGFGVGVAPGARLWLKAMGDENPRISDLTLATLDALQKEHIGIINHSTNLFDHYLIYHAAADDQTGILRTLTTSRSVIVAAAGNGAHDLSDALDTARSRAPNLTTFLDSPKEANHVLLVGVYDPSNTELKPLWNRPGHRLTVQSRFLVTASPTLDTASSGGDENYRHVSGTSFSAPLVSGALAVLEQVDSRLTPMQAAKILLETARRPSALGYGRTCKSQTPLGTFLTDCGAMSYGMGIMDLPAAVTRAKRIRAGSRSEK